MTVWKYFTGLTFSVEDTKKSFFSTNIPSSGVLTFTCTCSGIVRSLLPRPILSFSMMHADKQDQHWKAGRAGRLGDVRMMSSGRGVDFLPSCLLKPSADKASLEVTSAWCQCRCAGSTEYLDISSKHYIHTQEIETVSPGRILTSPNQPTFHHATLKAGDKSGSEANRIDTIFNHWRFRSFSHCAIQLHQVYWFLRQQADTITINNKH